MAAADAQDDRLHRLRSRLSRELLAEEQEIERLEQAMRDLRARHAELEEAFDRELAALDLPVRPSLVIAQGGASGTTIESKPAGETQEERVLADARRFARLLISEIALYNPSQVDEGRRHRDLYQRLKSSIDRSRQAYERRFAHTAAGRFSFFQEELVRTLAANDPSLLGSGYPGPSV
jgi:hypothetical protein